MAAVVALHATLPVIRPEDNCAIHGKVLVQTDAADAMVPAEMRAMFEAQMNEAGADWRMILCEGVQHAFTVLGASDYGMPGLRYDQSANKRFWRAMMDLIVRRIDEVAEKSFVLSERRNLERRPFFATER